MKMVVIVAIGGAAGAVGRYLVTVWAPAIAGTSFPWATFLVNVLGCLLIGLVLGAAGTGRGMTKEWQALLATGFCGGFTTFSTFSVDLLSAGATDLPKALFYGGGSIFLGLLGVVAGLYLGRQLF